MPRHTLHTKSPTNQQHTQEQEQQHPDVEDEDDEPSPTSSHSHSTLGYTSAKLDWMVTMEDQGTSTPPSTHSLSRPSTQRQHSLSLISIRSDATDDTLLVRRKSHLSHGTEHPFTESHMLDMDADADAVDIELRRQDHLNALLHVRDKIISLRKKAPPSSTPSATRTPNLSFMC